MKVKIYQIDAFTDRLFGGNPAAVCPLKKWLPDELMQKIASENNLSETAFYVKNKNNYEIRWFTPTIEVDLCGHATLAAAYVIFECELKKNKKEILFYSKRSGNLLVTKEKDSLTLNFPIDKITYLKSSKKFAKCFSIQPKEIIQGKYDVMLVYENEEQIKNLVPNFEEIRLIPNRGIIVTAKGNEVDFVSRFFAPQSGINEDPVTGSAHTTLIPYWNKILNKNEFIAKQLSEREGFIKCKYLNERIEISGKAKLFLKGKIYI